MLLCRYVLLYVLGQLVASAAAILKEKVFTEGQKRLGQPLNVFIVNFGGSAAQVRIAAFVPIVCHTLFVPPGAVPP